MADPRQQYLQDHAAFLARQQAAAQRPSMLSSIGDGIMSLVHGTSPYAVTPAAPADISGGPQGAADTANSPVIMHNVADDPSKSPQSQPDAPSADMSSKSNASQADVNANPMTAPSLGPYVPSDHAAALNDQTMPANTPAPATPLSPMLTSSQPGSGIGSLIQANTMDPDTKVLPVSAPAQAGRGAVPSAADRTGNPMLTVPTAAAQGIAGIANAPRVGAHGTPGTSIGQSFTDAGNSVAGAVSSGYNWLNGHLPNIVPQSMSFPTSAPPVAPGGPGGGTQTGGSTGGPGGGTQTGQSIFGPGGAPPDPMPAPTTGGGTATVDPNQQAVADIMQQKALIDAIYPQRPVDNSAQSAADAEAEKDRSRAGPEAMLALMSGIAQGSGGIWAGVGKGLAGAGTAYEQGFGRYQKALQSKADRAKTSADTAYSDQSGRADAAVKLYGQQQTLAKDNATTVRQAFKDRQDAAAKYYSDVLRLDRGTDMNPADPATVDRDKRAAALGINTGNIVYDNNDVRDHK